MIEGNLTINQILGIIYFIFVIGGFFCFIIWQLIMVIFEKDSKYTVEKYWNISYGPKCSGKTKILFALCSIYFTIYIIYNDPYISAEWHEIWSWYFCLYFFIRFNYSLFNQKWERIQINEKINQS